MYKGFFISLITYFQSKLFEIDKASIGSKDSNEMNGTENSWVPSVITESITGVIDETDTSKLRERPSPHNSLTPSPEQNFGKKLPQYNSFRVMKQKVIIIINKINIVQSAYIYVINIFIFKIKIHVYNNVDLTNDNLEYYYSR